MRKLIVFVLLTSFVLDCHAGAMINKNLSSMNGVYKKDAFGRINQYDKNGKKIGVYKLKNGKCVKIT